MGARVDVAENKRLTGPKWTVDAARRRFRISPGTSTDINFVRIVCTRVAAAQTTARRGIYVTIGTVGRGDRKIPRGTFPFATTQVFCV